MTRGIKVSFQQKAAMNMWVSVPVNFNLLVGKPTTGMNGVVAGSKLKKKDAFSNMADFVNGKCGTNWSSKDAETRWRSHYKSYTKTRVRIY